MEYPALLAGPGTGPGHAAASAKIVVFEGGSTVSTVT
jgi:hypothetical protein